MPASLSLWKLCLSWLWRYLITILFSKLRRAIPGRGTAISLSALLHRATSEVLLMPCLHSNIIRFTSCACSSWYMETVLPLHSSYVDLIIALMRCPDDRTTWTTGLLRSRCASLPLMTPYSCCPCLKVRLYSVVPLWQLLRQFHACSAAFVDLNPMSLVGTHVPWSFTTIFLPTSSWLCRLALSPGATDDRGLLQLPLVTLHACPTFSLPLPSEIPLGQRLSLSVLFWLACAWPVLTLPWAPWVTLMPYWLLLRVGLLDCFAQTPDNNIDLLYYSLSVSTVVFQYLEVLMYNSRVCGKELA